MLVSRMVLSANKHTRQCLTAALALSNETLLHNNHIKGIILPLLANLFLHTRNDQAFKMLHAAFSLARGMGATQDPKDVGIIETTVGNPRVGLWVGQRLLGK
jgi:hypothetical protein